MTAKFVVGDKAKAEQAVTALRAAGYDAASAVDSGATPSHHVKVHGVEPTDAHVQQILGSFGSTGDKTRHD
ncbi:MAG: hypothetical protein ACR2JU_05240 [Nocardioidaceae bacterium]